MMVVMLALSLLSPAFGNGDMIPALYTADGEDISPPLEWVLEGEAASYALICIDIDAPRGEWVHWIAYNIPGDSTSLAEGIPAIERLEDGTLQGTNSWGRIGYGGPAPPSGKHRYVFSLYALEGMLHLAAGATSEDLLAAMEGNILAETQLIGEYTRDR